MLVQFGLCRNCSETTLLVFSRCDSYEPFYGTTFCIWDHSQDQQIDSHRAVISTNLLRKHAHAIYRDFFSCKNCKIHKKNFDIFLIFAQNIDCGCTLEPPPRGGSNEYPQSMFWSKNKKNRYTPAYPSFTI